MSIGALSKVFTRFAPKALNFLKEQKSTIAWTIGPSLAIDGLTGGLSSKPKVPAGAAGEGGAAGKAAAEGAAEGGGKAIGSGFSALA
jgi:hypothetical protein